MDESIVKALFDYLKGSLIGEIAIILGIVSFIALHLHKVYRGVKNDTREDSITEEQDSFRHDLIFQLSEMRDENSRLNEKVEVLISKLQKSELDLRTIKMNIQVFKIVLKNKTTDLKLMELFDNIASFSHVSDENSLRRLGLSRSLAASATSTSVLTNGHQ